MAQVRLQGISRQFASSTVIEDITFQVPDRAFWVLVGPSGCGKSTILRTIAGLESITQGELYLGDRLVNNVPARQRDVAMVFQNYALYPHMTVRDNLAFGLKMRRYPAPDIARRVQEVARSLNLEHLLPRKPKQLSGGQQQRVALGRAIARQPQVFLLDEPLSNLDVQLRDEIREELKRLHRQFNITTIYVTHDQVEAMTLGEKIVVLDHGRVQQIGTPQEIYNHPVNSMVAGFLGNPPMNIIPATYNGDRLIISSHQSLPLNRELHQAARPLLRLTPGQKFNLGIRPEHLKIQPTSAQDDGDCLILAVDLVEPLGRETLVKSTVSGSNIKLNLLAHPLCQIRQGDRLTVKFDLAHLFVFEVNNGETVSA